MASFFRINPKAERALAERARAERDRKAQAALRYAKSIAPVFSGTYRDNLHVESDDDAARVVTSVDYGLVVEGRDNVLGRALAAERE